MNQHGPLCRTGKPSSVQGGFRFTGAQASPHTVHIGFDPCVIVVTMCPSWGIDLSCGDSCAAKGAYRKGGFLPASSFSVSHQRKGGNGPGIRRLIGRFLKAPVIDLNRGVIYALAPDPARKLPEKSFPVVFDVLIIDTVLQYEIQKYFVRYPAMIQIQRPNIQSLPDDAKKKHRVIGDPIAYRHIGIVIFQTDPFLFVRLIKCKLEIPESCKLRLYPLKILFNLISDLFSKHSFSIAPFPLYLWLAKKKSIFHAGTDDRHHLIFGQKDICGEIQ